MNFLLFVISLTGIAVALSLPEWADLLLISTPLFLASVFLSLRSWIRRILQTRQTAQNLAILDGSNIMHWKDGTPQIETVVLVIGYLERLGFRTGVVFDANAGYLVSGNYVHDYGFSQLLGLPKERVIVVPKGTPADSTILAAARDMGARIITNDRFRDWADDYPEVRDPGLLIKGGFRAGQLWLNLESSTT